MDGLSPLFPASLPARGNLQSAPHDHPLRISEPSAAQSRPPESPIGCKKLVPTPAPTPQPTTASTLALGPRPHLLRKPWGLRRLHPFPRGL